VGQDKPGEKVQGLARTKRGRPANRVDCRQALPSQQHHCYQSLIERLWKTVKYQEVRLKVYESISHARTELTKFFDRYNMRRPHQGLDDRTPEEVYWNTLPRVRDAV
jgi:transposase InsO family protein